ncbi:H-NS family nucleoid-associated regulatory protein [Cupriavidus basilensis]
MPQIELLRFFGSACKWSATAFRTRTWCDLAVFDGGVAGKVERYRSADGRTWNGQGELPDWLQRAVNAGQDIEHFRVE